jgi:hypothetical protein
VQPYDEDYYFFPFLQVMEHRWNETDRGKPKYWGKNLSQYHFVRHKSTWTGPVPNPYFGGGRPATNSPSHGTALRNLLIKSEYFGGFSEGRVFMMGNQLHPLHCTGAQRDDISRAVARTSVPA